MKIERYLCAAIAAGLLLLPAGTSRAEVICGKQPPLKPVRCLCGTVIDPTGGPVSGATLKVVQDGAELAAVTTGGDGKFAFGELKSGSYELNARVDFLLPFRSPILVANPAKKCRWKLVILLVAPYPRNCGSYVMKQ